MQRTALLVAYNGHPYHGWQTQSSNIPTVQGHLNAAINVVANEPVTIYCAGRTDTGVHASKQIVHFDSSSPRPDRAWVQGVNAHLPDAISVHWAGEVPTEFNARRSATARHYMYLIHNARVRSSLMHGYLSRERRQLDADAMHEAGQALIGEHDFSSFRAANCQSVSPMRNVSALSVSRMGELVVVQVVANAFLHHMVRNIVGVLADIGAGVQPIGWTSALLALRDRTRGGVTAPPDGLYLIDVHYPGYPQIPTGPNLPHLLQLFETGTIGRQG